MGKRTTTWKQHERRVAGRLGGQRVGNRGTNTEDVEHPTLSIECKHRKELPGWLKDAIAQAHTNAPAGKLPIVVLHELGQRSDNDMVVLRLADFETWVERNG